MCVLKKGWGAVCVCVCLCLCVMVFATWGHVQSLNDQAAKKQVCSSGYHSAGLVM